jgi:methionyl-tRNA synthetase
LIGKLINIASRCSGFINKNFAGELSSELDDEKLFNTFSSASESIASHFEAREYSKAMKHIMLLADLANRYIEEKKPWLMIKNNDQTHEVQAVCTQGMNLFRLLMIYLTPVIPEIANKVKHLFDEEEWCWDNTKTPLLNTKIRKYKPLLTRVEKEKVDKMIEESKETTKTDNSKPKENYITIEDFLKVDLRVAQITNAKIVEGADTLLELSLDLGDSQRKVFAGIKSAYKIDDLLNKHVVVAANLAPRKMRFGISEGMVLAAGPGNSDIFLLSVDNGAKPGMKIK